MRPVPTEPPGEIRSITGALGIDSPRFEWAAVQLYLRAKDRPKSSYQALRAAAVYASCRLLGVPKTLKDVSAATGVRASDIAREYRRMLLEENLKVRPPDPAAFIPGIARKAGLEPSVERRAVEILSTLKEAQVWVGKAPRTERILVLLIVVLGLLLLVSLVQGLVRFLETSSQPLVVGLDIAAVIADPAILGLILWEDFFSPFLCDPTQLFEKSPPFCLIAKIRIYS